MPLSAGDHLGPYELLAPLGAGGMGEVWKARDTRLDRIVAVKRLKGEHSGRFEQEARAIAALNHPHICQIYDVGPDYLVMEYVEGKPLSGPLPLEDAVKLALQIAGALEEAHAARILHRDLKPANILVTSKGATKLLDFGLAKLTAASDSAATQTIEGAVLGTAAYMSPEQAQGRALDERSDIFSFGAVLYEVLSGRRAFSGGSMLETLNAVVRSELAPLDSPASAVVKRCMAKDPSQRFQSATELKVALAQVSAKSENQALSIAVLPFANMSASKDDEYFSDGLAEEIINALAQLPGLKVTARTSAFAFRGKEQDIRGIAEALDVRTILEGSVRRAGNRIRVTAQLINAQDGYHLWSQRYDRELADVFEVQDEIAAAIAAALQLKLTPRSVTERYKPSLPAYEAYLKAKHHRFRYTPESWERAKQYCEQAIALDPRFAVAHSELGGLYMGRAIFGLSPPQEVLPETRAWVQKALDLDASLPEAHALLAIMAGSFNYEWKEAERQFGLAMARDPVPAMVRLYYTVYLVTLGRPHEALEQIRRAVEEDPLFAVYRMWLAISLWVVGREEEAIRELRHHLELDESYYGLHNLLSMILASQGELTQALHHAERVCSLAPHLPYTAGLLAGLLARAGETSRAEELLKKLGPPENYGIPRAFAFFHLAQGETEKAVDWWEKMIDQRDNNAPLMPRLPNCKALRDSPRWPALAKRMNLPAR